MLLRASVSFLSIAVWVAVGQSGGTVKAGDLAPQIVWTKVLRPTGALNGAPLNLFGSVTVVFFFPNLSKNEKLVGDWNGLVADFAGQPVNFLWITPEEESSLGPMLHTLPIQGWLLRDAKSETAKEYGIEMMGATIVGASGKIAGFTHMLPSAEQIKAVLEGKSVALHGEPSDEQMNAILAGQLVWLQDEPLRMPRPTEKPNVPPSYEAHITPTKTSWGCPPG